MSWSNIGNPSQDTVTTNFPNPVGFQTTHSTFNLPPIQIPTIPTTPATPSIPTIPSFEQILASTLQQNNLPTNNLLPSFSAYLPHLPHQTMNPYDSRSYPTASGTTAWAAPYGIAYTPASQRTTTQTSPTNSSTSQYYSVIPAKRVHPETNRSDRHSSDSRHSNDNHSSRHSSSRGSSSSDRNHYDSSKRHRSGSERSSTSSLRPSSSNYSSNGSSSSRRSEHTYPSSSSRTSSSYGSHGSSRSSSSTQPRGNIIPPLPPPPPIVKQGVLNNINGRVTIDRFQEYARLVGSYPYVRDLLHDVPSQFELSNEPAYQAIFELAQPSGAPRLLMKRVSIDLPEEVYSQMKRNPQLRVHMRTFVLKSSTTEHSWPQSTQLMVNNNVITIVSKANDKKLQDLPADITPYCRPGANFIDFTSYPQEHHVAAVQVVRLIPAEELFNNKKNDVQPYDVMFQKVLDFFHAGDSEIAATKMKVSLIDSLSLQKIQYPARASTCLPHLQCFDLYSYIMANYKMGKWQCPVCSKKAAYRNLFVDSYTQRILTELAEQQKLSNTREVEIHPDGTWNRVDEDQKKRFESVKLDDFKSSDAQSSPSRSSNAKKNNVIQVINLDSDDEDEDNSYSAPAPSNMNNNTTARVIKEEYNNNGSTNQFSLDDIASAATRELAPIMQEHSYNNEDVHNSSGDFAIDLNAPDLDYFDFGVDQASTYQNNNNGTTFTSQYVNTTPTTSNRNGANLESIIILDDD